MENLSIDLQKNMKRLSLVTRFKIEFLLPLTGKHTTSFQRL